MEALYRSGAILDLAIAITTIELVLLLVASARGKIALKPGEAIGQVLAGLCLMIALRAHVAGLDYRLTLVILTAALPAHGYDLARRLRGGPPRPPSA
ncbi:MAG: hypothetical protein JNL21_21595 [Myxococcales bacterium]|nr:hypothetical protein [Myxococcales bacterium]